jgi:hypothetical protein
LLDFPARSSKIFINWFLERIKYMKKTLFIIGCCFLLFVYGCSDRTEEEESSDEQQKTTDKTTAGEPNGFPGFLVGTWIANRGKWEFVFEPDGTISSAVIDNGLIRVNPRQRYNRFDDGIVLKIYELGDWAVEYLQEENELTVEVVVDNYSLEKEGIVMEGNSRDWFIGEISEDRQSWTAEWYSIEEFKANDLREDSGETIDFKFDPSNTKPRKTIFTKLQ